MLSRAHAMLQLERLLRVYKRPAYAPADAGSFAADYAEICRQLTDQQFTAAVDAALRGTGKFFPKPGELLALAGPAALSDDGSLDTQYRRWEQLGYKRHSEAQAFSPCPVCGAEATWLEVRPGVSRLYVLHDANQYYAVRVAFVGWAAPGTGGRQYEWKPVAERNVRPKPGVSFRGDLTEPAA